MPLFYRDPVTTNLVEITTNPVDITLADTETDVEFVVTSDQNEACEDSTTQALAMAPAIRWIGDTVANGIAGIGTAGVPSHNPAGTVSSSFTIVDSFGAAQGPAVGQTVTITFFSEDDQQLASATFDYSSTIDMEADTPTSSSGATYVPPAKYSDTSTTPIVFTWSDFQNHFVAGSCDIDGSGNGSFAFNKKDFSVAENLEDENAISVRVNLTATSSLGTSAPSRMDMCIFAENGAVSNPYAVIPVTADRSIIVGNSNTLQAVGDVSTAECGVLPTIRSIDTVLDSRFSSAAQTLRIQGEAPFVISAGSGLGTFRYYYRNTNPDAFDWSTLYTSEEIATDLQTYSACMDDVNLVNGKPVIVVSLLGTGGTFIPSALGYNYYFIYWDGAAWTYGAVAPASTFTTKTYIWVDSATGDLYYESQNDLRYHEYTGPDLSITERLDPTNYNSFVKIMDVTPTASPADGITGVGVTARGLYYNYAGQYNGKPSFSSGFSNSSAWSWTFWNGANWETKLLMDFAGTSTASALPAGGTVTNSNMDGFNVQYLGSVRQSSFPEGSDPTTNLTWFFFDYINDIVYEGTFTSGDITQATWSMDIVEYIPKQTGSSTSTLY